MIRISVNYSNGHSSDTRPKKNKTKNGILVYILLHIYANLWLQIPKFGGSKKSATFWYLKNYHFMAQQMANRSHIQQEARRLYAELLFFMFYILYIYIFLVIFLQKFNFYGFYIAVAPRLNSI